MDKEKGMRTDEYRQGLIYVLICQLMWGFLPIYWQALSPIESWKIILYRFLTMFICSYIFARIKYGKEQVLAPIKDKKNLLVSFAAGLLLAMNWSIYIWAMTTGHFIQSSIGYYIEPLVICAFGIVVFHEKLTKYNLTAMVFAAAAIVIILIHYAQLPIVALGLAFSWAIYSAVKKSSDLPSPIALVYETMPYAVISSLAIVYIETKGIGALGMGVPGKYALMWLSGLMTFIPISLFGHAAKKTTLLVIGLTQYISPTITLLLGIFLYHEDIDMVQVISFVIIWIGLVFFSYGELQEHRQGGK